VTTIEGLGTLEKLHPIQKAFVDEQAMQCGYCINGVIMTAKALLDRNPRAGDQQIQQAMATVLCRCASNVRMIRAIKRYAKAVNA
jgi:nicotinate dehydrogenase subunit A